MKNLLSFLVKNITGKSEFEIIENEENGRVNLTLKMDPESIGLVIGKEGKTIKNIRKILSVLGVFKQKSVNISVSES